MAVDRAANPWPLAWGLTSLCAVTLLGGSAFVVHSLRPERVSAPEQFAEFTAADDTFACDAPEGWDRSAGAAHGIFAAARFTRGGAEVQISADLIGSLVGDLLTSPAGMLADLPAEVTAGVPGMDGAPMIDTAALEDLKRPPVERLHEADAEIQEQRMKKRGYRRYEEGPMESFNSAMGDARFSSFTAGGHLFAGTARGYRVTILGNERLINVIAFCPEADWAELDEPFKRIISSVRPARR